MFSIIKIKLFNLLNKTKNRKKKCRDNQFPESLLILFKIASYKIFKKEGFFLFLAILKV